jgi:hypothetical protein
MSNINESNFLKGGNADNKSLEDITKKFKVTISTLNHELRLGIDVEKEHTQNRSTAKEIAMDHLSEIPDYYTRLKKMEKEALKHWEKKHIKESLRNYFSII